MYYSPNPSFLSDVLDGLSILLPNLVISVVVSVIGSIVLTVVTYWLSFAVGLPTIPFMFILV
jgi:hypothetical protein